MAAVHAHGTVAGDSGEQPQRRIERRAYKLGLVGRGGDGGDDGGGGGVDEPNSPVGACEEDGCAGRGRGRRQWHGCELSDGSERVGKEDHAGEGSRVQRPQSEPTALAGADSKRGVRSDGARAQLERGVVRGRQLECAHSVEVAEAP